MKVSEKPSHQRVLHMMCHVDSLKIAKKDLPFPSLLLVIFFLVQRLHLSRLDGWQDDAGLFCDDLEPVKIITMLQLILKSLIYLIFVPIFSTVYYFLLRLGYRYSPLN